MLSLPETMAAVPPVLAVSGLRKSYRTPEGELKLVVHVESFELAAGAQVGSKDRAAAARRPSLTSLRVS
ncbi:MAG TPA: hypothetical protein VNR00_04415 [Opitutus sp.]|nr:hypothetical protein [Opitutus sp.]